MSNLQICRICLQTACKMYKYDRFNLQSYYCDLLHEKVKLPDDLPCYFCFECSTLLHKFHRFKLKCFNAYNTLKGFAIREGITYEAIKKLDRNKLNLTYLGIVNMKKTKRVQTYDVGEATVVDSDSEMEIPDSKSDIPDSNSNIDTCEDLLENIDLDPCEPELVKVESKENLNMELLDENSIQPLEFDGSDSDKSQIEETTEDIIKSICNSKSNVTKRSKKRKEGNNRKRGHSADKDEAKLEYVKGYKKKTQVPDPSLWKRWTLSEEAAWKDFRARATDQKYVAAEYKCERCYIWFRAEEKLKRHNAIKHDESRGNKQCMFCQSRFTWNAHMRKHAAIHYQRFQCLKCDFQSCSEGSALAHEAMHSEVQKQCPQCGHSFKHLSTYYTHLRTHRSDFVCTLCGESFVSQLGLDMHKNVKHCTPDLGIQSDDDDDTSVNTYCEKCSTRFETRKAYIEHIFQATAHEDDIALMEDLVKQTNKKIPSKDPKDVVRRNRGGKSGDVKSKSRGTSKKRLKRKPTTCYQCGESFETQNACMKHHRKQHPGKPFYPNSEERHICEICGASLAPGGSLKIHKYLHLGRVHTCGTCGRTFHMKESLKRHFLPGSIAMHENLHSRRVLHTCETCGRSFHMKDSLKRHYLVHTGEKPFACSLCSKRFTQSGSLKLHFRTFHLKQPYPKRNRRKKEPKDLEMTNVKLNLFSGDN